MQSFLAKFTGSHHLDVMQNSLRMPNTSFNFRTNLLNHTITMFRTRPHSQSHLKPGAHGNECKKTFSWLHMLPPQVCGSHSHAPRLLPAHIPSGSSTAVQVYAALSNSSDLNRFCAEPLLHKHIA